MSRTWQTKKFWLDTFERVMTAMLSALLPIIPTVANYKAMHWADGAYIVLGAGVTRLVLCLIAGMSGNPESASFFSPPVEEVEGP